jgi:hypothetical protein
MPKGIFERKQEVVFFLIDDGSLRPDHGGSKKIPSYANDCK